ncbi:MAG: ABC transporter permease [Planctomycetota bacterium]
MTGAWVVARRELSGLFKAPFTWIVILVVLFLNGLLFNAVLVGSNGDVTDSLSFAQSGIIFWLAMIFLPALLAMRLVAEESRTGTLEYLLTAPVSDGAVVFGKFCAATAFMGLLWTSSLVYAGALQLAGGPPDWAAVVGTWVGTVFVSALFVAIAMLASTLTSTPLLAAFLSMVACVAWLVIPWLAARALDYIVPLFARTDAAREAVNETVGGLVSNMDAFRHFERSFQLGVFDTSEIVFFVTWTAFFLFLTARMIEARRWRG